MNFQVLPLEEGKALEDITLFRMLIRSSFWESVDAITSQHITAKFL
jgi:hypothetical protein